MHTFDYTIFILNEYTIFILIEYTIFILNVYKYLFSIIT